MKLNTKFVGNMIPMNIYRKLKDYSDKTGKKKQRIMTEALDAYFKKIEDKNESRKDK